MGSIMNQGKSALLITNEINLAKKLAANEQNVRDKAVKRLKKWLTARSDSTSEFTEDDLLRIWKGLFYCMWMSDKPLIQEDLAENISHLIHCFSKPNQALIFAKCCFKILCIEWSGLDQHRMDKFLMLIRRCLRQNLEYCKNLNWDVAYISGLAEILRTTILSTVPIDEEIVPPLGITLHFSEIFLEELAKVGGNTLTSDIVLEFIKPFGSFMADQNDTRGRLHVSKHIFRHLIDQSDYGLERKEKFQAWKEAGCPGRSWRAMVLVDDENGDVDNEEEEEEDDDNFAEKPLDPRAGHVDVMLHQIPFDPESIINELRQHLKLDRSASVRRTLKHIISEYMTMIDKKKCKSGKEIDDSPLPNVKNSWKKAIKRKAEELVLFESNIVEKEGTKRLKGKKSKKEFVNEIENFTNDDNSTIKNKNAQEVKLISDNKSGGNQTKNIDTETWSNGESTAVNVGRKREELLTDQNITKKLKTGNLKKSKNLKLVCLDGVTSDGISTDENYKTPDLNPSLDASDGTVHSDKKTTKRLKRKNLKESKTLKMLCNDNGISADESCKTVDFHQSFNSIDDTAIINGKVKDVFEVPQWSDDESTEIFNGKDDGLSLKNVNKHGELNKGLTYKVLKKVDGKILKKRTKSRTKKLVLNPLYINSDNRSGQSIQNRKEKNSQLRTNKEDQSNPLTSSNSSEMKIEYCYDEKKVNIALRRNKSQGWNDYILSVKSSPEIPFDGTKKPIRSALKARCVPSPINPVYIFKRLKKQIQLEDKC